MYSRTETITPEIAEEYLQRNIENNRKIKPKAIANYARDIKTGKWQLSHQGIAFNQSGNLIDGQNRLRAIIKAGIPTEIYVTYDVPDETTIQDRGVPRSTSDVLRMSGMQSAASTTNGVAAVNFLFSNAGRVNISDDCRQSFIKENEELLSKAVNICARGSQNSNVCKKACNIAAAFCALYCGIEEDGLIRFFEVANTGFLNDQKETAAIVFRNNMLFDYTGTTFLNRRNAFNMALNAIRDFASGTTRTKKYRTDAEPPFWKWVRKDAIEKYLIDYPET